MTNVRMSYWQQTTNNKPLNSENWIAMIRIGRISGVSVISSVGMWSDAIEFFFFQSDMSIPEITTRHMMAANEEEKVIAR